MTPLTCAFLFVVGCIAINGARNQSEKVCTLLQSGEKCRATYYTACTAEFLQREYPGLYNQNNITTTTPNLTTVTRDNLTRKQETYSEVDVIIRPNADSTAGIKGYEVWIESIQGLRCVVVTLSDNRTLSDKETISGFKFTLDLNMFTNITVWTLPKSASSHPARSLIRAGINLDFPPENSSLWYTNIWYRNNSRDRIVEVQFQSAPERYGIRYYNIQLRQVTPMSTRGASYRTTSHSWMEFKRYPWIYVKFRDVKPGMYEVKVEPYDDLKKSKNKMCRCKIKAECTSCKSTTTPNFTISETQPYITELTDLDTKTPMMMRIFDTNDIKKSLHTPQSTNSTTIIKTPNEIFTQTSLVLGQSSSSSILNPSLSKVSENSKTRENFSGNIDGVGESQRSGKEWKIPVSVFSVIGIAVGTLVSIFAVVRFKRVQLTVSKSIAGKQTRAEKSVLIVHDITHSEDAQRLMSVINKGLHISVETGMFPNKGNLLNNSDSPIIILWMTQQSFKKFECSFLKDKEIPSLAQAHLQSRFVVIESSSAECSVQPRIQYWAKFVLDTELELFLDFLHHNTPQELRKSWTTYQHISTEVPEKSNVFQGLYSRMDSGFHSEYENEADVPYEGNCREEYASVAAVTIAECKMGVPSRDQNKVVASFPHFNFSNSAISENADALNRGRRNSDISPLHKKECFIPPEAMSYDIDGSLFSEAMMFLNERNMRPTEASENSLFLIDEHINKHCTTKNHRSDTPVCFQNMIGYEEVEEELEDEGRPFLDEDTISVGGKSC